MLRQIYTFLRKQFSSPCIQYSTTFSKRLQLIDSLQSFLSNPKMENHRRMDTGRKNIGDIPLRWVEGIGYPGRFPARRPQRRKRGFGERGIRSLRGAGCE